MLSPFFRISAFRVPRSWFRVLFKRAIYGELREEPRLALHHEEHPAGPDSSRPAAFRVAGLF